MALDPTPAVPHPSGVAVLVRRSPPGEGDEPLNTTVTTSGPRAVLRRADELRHGAECFCTIGSGDPETVRASAQRLIADGYAGDVVECVTRSGLWCLVTFEGRAGDLRMPRAALVVVVERAKGGA